MFSRSLHTAIAWYLLLVGLIPWSIEGSSVSYRGWWTWVGGSDVSNSRSNTSIPFPGSRLGSSAWFDSNDNLWLFGGKGFANSGGRFKPLNDLWLYEPNKNKWQSINADSADYTASRPPCFGCASCSHFDQAVVFGGKTEGTWVFNMTSQEWGTAIEKSGSVPRAREEPAAWCDREHGTLWMFGGSNSSEKLSDFWKFSLIDMQWEKVSPTGNQTSSVPEARSGSSTWLHPSGNLYLYGGQSKQGLVSDLWVFTPQSSTWQRLWLGNSPEQGGHYGVMHTAAKENSPGCRKGALSWNDGNGNLWLFGGSGYDKDQSAFRQPGLLSDMWFYNTTSMLWAWMGGLDKSEEKPIYGRKGVPDVRNLPGPRESGVSFRWDDRLWIFGGEGHDKHQMDGALNDIWVYSSLPTKPKPKLEGDTLKISDELRIMIGLIVLIVAMIVSLLVCYRKDCCILFKTKQYEKAFIRYKPVKVRMQVPSFDVDGPGNA